MERGALTATVADRSVREGSAQKRAAIVRAARELFAIVGFDRTSVDAIALQAGVSKRTVYDYYGDKRTLLLAVLEDTGQSLLDGLRQAIARHLPDAKITDISRLEAGLTAFAMDVMTSMIDSSDYASVYKLIAAERGRLPELRDHPLADAPEDALAERFAHFAAIGLLEVPKPRLAADHFNALTFLLAYNDQATIGSESEEPRVTESITEGVRAFIRAYSPR